MTRLLIRTHLIESDLEFSYLPADSARMIFEQEQAKLFKKEGISEEAFRKSYNFYLRNPKYLDVIYAAVVDSLSLRETITTQRETIGEEEITTPSPSPAAPADTSLK